MPTPTYQNAVWLGNLYLETAKQWFKYGTPDEGYSIFYSPIPEKVNLLIIGANPAPNSEFQLLNVGIPAVHDYKVQDYALALKMRSIFREADLLPELYNSVKLNMNFFASKDFKTLMRQPFYRESEAFCSKKVVEIINKLQPQLILTEGIDTFDMLQFLLPGTIETSLMNRSRYFTAGRLSNNIPVIGMAHPTGTRHKNETWNDISALIFRNYKKHIKHV